MAESEISVIVRTRNEARHLPAALAVLTGQRLESRPEVVVVDSGSTDGTLDIARGTADRLVEAPAGPFSFGRALNLGAEAAHGHILVLLSAHALPAGPDWLAELTAPLNDMRVAGVYGRQLPRPDAWPPVAVDYRRCYGPLAAVHDRPEDVFFSNANSTLRRDLWRRFPFDEGLPACEDQDWARRAVCAGYRIAYRPTAAVYHSHNEGPLSLIRRRQREERGRQAVTGEDRPRGRAWEDWLRTIREDYVYIRHKQREWRWFCVSPAYRFLWAFSPWYSYV